MCLRPCSPHPRLRLPTSSANQSPAPKAKPRPCLAWAPPLTHLRRLRARAGCWGLREKDRVWWERRGGESPTLAQVAQRGWMGSLRRRRQPGRSRDPGAQRWRLHLHQGLHLRRDRPPHRAPPITTIPPPRVTSGPTLSRQATGPNTERPQARETAEGKKKKGEELGENSRAPKDLSPKGLVVQRLSQIYPSSASNLQTRCTLVALRASACLPRVPRLPLSSLILISFLFAFVVNPA